MILRCLSVYTCIYILASVPGLPRSVRVLIMRRRQTFENRFSNVCRLRIIGASVSESHLGSSTRPLSVSLSVCLSIYIYIYIYHTSVIFGPVAPALRANVSRLIGASVSEPPLVDSIDGLAVTIDIYIDVRTFTDTAHARRYAQT